MGKKETLKDCLVRDALDLIKLNLLFLLCCLPLISIPAALTAMTKVNLQMQKGDKVYIVGDFLRTFREEFFDSLLCGLILAVAALGLGYVSWFYQTMEMDSGMFLILLRAMTLLPLLVIYCASCYLWVMNVMIECSLGRRLRNALALTVICIRQTLLCLLAGILFSLVGIGGLPYSTPFLVVVGFALWNYICTYYTFPMIELHVMMPKDDL